jgi:hypothetical protein
LDMMPKMRSSSRGIATLNYMKLKSYSFNIGDCFHNVLTM